MPVDADEALRTFEPWIQKFAILLEPLGRHREDLAQEGRLAVVVAARRASHLSPAFFLRIIKGQMQHYLRDRSRVIRLPASKASLPSDLRPEPCMVSLNNGGNGDPDLPGRGVSELTLSCPRATRQLEAALDRVCLEQIVAGAELTTAQKRVLGLWLQSETLTNSQRTAFCRLLRKLRAEAGRQQARQAGRPVCLPPAGS